MPNDKSRNCGTPEFGLGQARLVVPPLGLLVVGVLAQSEPLIDEAVSLLETNFSPVAARSSVIPFDFTDYYESEMGRTLKRRWLCFERPVEQDRLAGIKRETGKMEAMIVEGERQGTTGLRNRREQRSSLKSRRSVNLDPGILTLHSLVLASTKNFAHRIYLGEGIYAEVTLIFRAGRYEPLPWTYPDYRSETCLSFLLACRGRMSNSGYVTVE